MLYKGIKARCTNTKQVVLTEPLEEEEVLSIIALANALETKVTISQSGKILIFKCNELAEVLEILSTHGLIEYIGSLKEIIDWNIVSEDTSNPAKIIQFNKEKDKL